MLHVRPSFWIIYRLGYLPLILPTYFSVGLLLGIVLLSPLVLQPLATFCAWLMRPMWRLESRLALKQVLRHRTRSTLTAGVLFVAGSTGVGIAYTIMDNVDDVRDWYRQAFVADFFIRNDKTRKEAPILTAPAERGILMRT